MRTCPNAMCRIIHDDSVGQCPECGAPMGRRPDQPVDANSALYQAAARANAERGLESRFASRRNGGGAEFDAGAAPQVNEAAHELAAGILELYGLA